ncbi:MAG: GntR family transcriptional regulator [Bradyrhizobium sp.]|nr:GntR family transcriptional regulator [Bradyrhizobium sp.]
MDDLEQGRMVPGQRLAETDLAARFGVGRNAVREAMQQLTARGIIDLSRNRSPSIRQLDQDETMEVLDVASALSQLVASSAATRYNSEAHASMLAASMDLLIEAYKGDELGMFSRARRQFYRTLLLIGGNRELQRLFPAVGMHIIYAQYQTRRLRGIRLTDYRRIIDAVAAGDVKAAEQASYAHVERVRRVVLERSTQ